jgi:hypothetical protein
MDMVGVELVMIGIYIFLVSLLALISPTLLFGFYVLWMMFGDSGGGNDGLAVPQRLYINIFTVIAVTYYMLDFHFGWVSYKIMGSVISKESLDGVASFNLVIGMMSVILFFIGHEVYRLGSTWLLRVILFSIAIYFGFKMLSPIADYIVTELVTQSTDEIVARNM